MKQIKEIELQQIVNCFTNSISILEHNFCRTHNITIKQLHEMQHKNKSITTYLLYILCIASIILFFKMI